jgi:hypothetical protein
MVQASMHDGTVDRAHDELGIEAEHEHQTQHRRQGEALARGQVAECKPSLVQWAEEDPLQNEQQENGCNEKADDGQGSRPGDERERSFEDEEFSGKAVQAGQSERREDRDAHQTAEDGRDSAQSAEIVEAAQAPAALLKHGYKPEQRRGGQSVIKNLQKHAIEGSGAFGRERGARPLQSGEDPEHAISQVINGGVGEDSLHIRLHPCDEGRDDDAGHSKPEQKGERMLHLLGKNWHENAQHTVNSHLRDGTGQEHGGA